MKRIIGVLLAAVMLAGLCSCGGVFDVRTPDVESELYSQREIDRAIHAVKFYFWREFDGCILTELKYAGDEVTGDYGEWAQRHNADEVIVLTSSFWVGPTGGDGSLNPNSDYQNWKWIFVRSGNGSWRHADHGY